MLAISLTILLTKNSCGELRLPEVVALGSLMCVNLLSYASLGCLPPDAPDEPRQATLPVEDHWAEKSETVVPAAAVPDDLSVVSLEQSQVT